MERILGIDTGTNSLGWAIVDKGEEGTQLVAKGTNIFSEGVKIEKVSSRRRQQSAQNIVLFVNTIGGGRYGKYDC
jgi:CRISPR-associated endonuclease Csn1